MAARGWLAGALVVVLASGSSAVETGLELQGRVVDPGARPVPGIAPNTPGHVGKWQSGIRVAMLRDRDDVQIVLDPDPPTTTAAGASPRP